MRAAFLLMILVVGALYTYTAFVALDFLSSTGRLGPGFFPRIIGGTLTVVCLYSLIKDFKLSRLGAPASAFWQPVALISMLSAAFVLLLNIVGALLAMILFLFTSLSMLNRDRLVQNMLISLLLPLGLYALFDLWLHASMPEGLIPLPL